MEALPPPYVGPSPAGTPTPPRSGSPPPRYPTEICRCTTPAAATPVQRGWDVLFAVILTNIILLVLVIGLLVLSCPSWI